MNELMDEATNCEKESKGELSSKIKNGDFTFIFKEAGSK